MIPIQSQIFTALGGYAGLSERVGTRIYPDIAPQSVTRPFVVWQEITLVQAQDLGGSAESNSLNNYHIQITSWAVSGSLARDIDAQVRLAMNAATAFKSLLSDSRALAYEPDTKLHGIQTDFSVWQKS